MLRIQTSSGGVEPVGLAAYRPGAAGDHGPLRAGGRGVCRGAQVVPRAPVLEPARPHRAAGIEGVPVAPDLLPPGDGRAARVHPVPLPRDLLPSGGHIPRGIEPVPVVAALQPASRLRPGATKVAPSRTPKRPLPPSKDHTAPIPFKRIAPDVL